MPGSASGSRLAPPLVVFAFAGLMASSLWGTTALDAAPLGNPPTITEQPTDQVVPVGGQAIFSVKATSEVAGIAATFEVSIDDGAQHGVPSAPARRAPPSRARRDSSRSQSTMEPRSECS